MARQERIVDPEKTQYNYSVTGRLLATTLLVIVLGVIAFGGFWWLNSEFGRMGPVMAVMIVLLVFLPVLYTALGARTANQAQEHTGRTMASMAQMMKQSNANAAASNHAAKTNAMREQFELRQQHEQWRVLQKQERQQVHLPVRTEQDQWMEQARARPVLIEDKNSEFRID